METYSFLQIILAAALVASTSFAGALFAAKIFKGVFVRIQSFLVSFAAGVFVVAGVTLALEAEHMVGIFLMGAIVVAAFALFHAMSLLWPEHHQHGDGQCKHCAPRRGVARRLIIGDGVHNIVDGVLLASTFLISKELGIATVIAIWLHEVVQEVSEFVVFRSAGYTIKRTLWLNALTSLTIFIGVGMAFLAQQYLAHFEGPLMAFSAGAFLYIALRDLIPHSVAHSRSQKKYMSHIVMFVLGIVLMVGVGQITPHEHGDEHHHEAEGIHPQRETEEAHEHDEHEESEERHEHEE